jgi:hypothetical protein
VHLHFAAGKLAEELGEPERAFDHIALANARKREGYDYSAAARSATVDAIIETVDAAFLQRLAGQGCEQAAPVFIVGMPRSGTTLVEQILASHSLVAGAGEIDYFRELARVMPERLGVPQLGYPGCLERLQPGELAGIASAYLCAVRRALGATMDTVRHVTDKMPSNVDHLGLIAAIFPRARFVHCLRDPRDTCLSVFMTHFNADNPYAYDLAEIAAHHRDHERLMAHWRRLLGGRIHDVDYAALVRDQEAATVALLQFLSLPFEHACLDFHRTERRVATASFWQVRQPLYRSAEGRWQRYAHRLGPLLEALGDG